jgi:hypothetical protein
MRSVLINMFVPCFVGRRIIMQQSVANEQTGRGRGMLGFLGESHRSGGGWEAALQFMGAAQLSNSRFGSCFAVSHFAAG